MTATTTADAADIATDAAAKSPSSSPHQACPATDSHQQSSPTTPISSDAELQLEGILFVVGDALLDVYADVSRQFLESHYLPFGRAIVATETHKGHLIAMV